VTVKATAELFTEPKDFWDGETGFQTAPEDWNPERPDNQPYDWIYGWTMEPAPRCRFVLISVGWSISIPCYVAIRMKTR